MNQTESTKQPIEDVQQQTPPESKSFFMEKVRIALIKELGDQASVTIHRVSKNNGVIAEGIVIREEDRKIAPTIYLDTFFEQYQAGTTLRYIIDCILHIYHSHIVQNDSVMDDFFTYDKIKALICYKLISVEKNTKLLEDVPYVPFLDMAIVFYCLITLEDMQSGSILIHNELLDIWGVNLDEIYTRAKENTPKLLAPAMVSMYSMIEDLMKGTDMDEESRKEELPTADGMYVLTNQQKYLGACSILYPNLEELLPEPDCDYYILPSSIHETIFLKARVQDDVETLRRMVCEVNDTQLTQEEILSESIYYYSGESKKITCL